MEGLAGEAGSQPGACAEIANNTNRGALHHGCRVKETVLCVLLAGESICVFPVVASVVSGRPVGKSSPTFASRGTPCDSVMDFATEVF